MEGLTVGWKASVNGHRHTDTVDSQQVLRLFLKGPGIILLYLNFDIIFSWNVDKRQEREVLKVIFDARQKKDREKKSTFKEIKKKSIYSR